MKKLAISFVVATATTVGAYAATMTMSAAPTESWTVTNYYKQDVYDPKESKIGKIDDVLVDKSGKVTGLVVGVGGFLGADHHRAGPVRVRHLDLALAAAPALDCWPDCRPVVRARPSPTSKRSHQASVPCRSYRPSRSDQYSR